MIPRRFIFSAVYFLWAVLPAPSPSACKINKNERFTIYTFFFKLWIKDLKVYSVQRSWHMSKKTNGLNR